MRSGRCAISPVVSLYYKDTKIMLYRLCPSEMATLLKNTGTKFHQDILTFTHVIAFTGRETDERNPTRLVILIIYVK